MNEYMIVLSFDDEAQKWYALNDEIPIALEDFSLDTLINRVKLAVPEMLEMNNSCGMAKAIMILGTANKQSKFYGRRKN